MIKIQNALLENPYLSNQTNTSFTVLLEETVKQNVQFYRLKNLKYVHGLIKYPEYWPYDADLFQYLSADVLELIRLKKAYFIFDASTEGFSPLYDTPYFDILYNNCKKYDIDLRQIIYASSNLLDEGNLEQYVKKKDVKKINVFSFVGFEYSITYKHGYLDTDQYFINKKYITVNTFKGKYFSSLSRLNRPNRARATFLLCQDDIKNKALISHDQLDDNLTNYLYNQFDKSTVDLWKNTLPLTVDQTDFNINWALINEFSHIHDQTLFQIVNETEADNRLGSSLFYSEKTFRPISQLQPFVIYGQQHCNKHLKKIGYKLYEDWFDYSFDDEPDNLKRYVKLLNSIKSLCNYLDTLSDKEKVEWRFKNRDILIDNYNTLISKSFSKSKMCQFLSSVIKAQSK